MTFLFGLLWLYLLNRFLIILAVLMLFLSLCFLRALHRHLLSNALLFGFFLFNQFIELILLIFVQLLKLFLDSTPTRYHIFALFLSVFGSTLLHLLELVLADVLFVLFVLFEHRLLMLVCALDLFLVIALVLPGLARLLLLLTLDFPELLLPLSPLFLLDLTLLLLLLLLNHLLCLLIERHRLLKPRVVFLMLLALQVIIHLLLVLEHLLACLTPVLLDYDLLEIPIRERLLLLLRVPLGDFLAVLAEFLLVLSPLFVPLLFLPLPFRFFFSHLNELEALVARVTLLQVLYQLYHNFVELLALHLPLLLILRLDKSLDATVWRLIRVVLVRVRELFRGREILP